MVSVGISSFGRTKLWFLLICCEDKWFVLPEHATAATSFSSHSFNIWTFLCVSTKHCPGPGSPCSQNGCTAAVGWDSGLYRTAVLYPRKRRTLWTSYLNIVIVRLRTSRYWVVVQLYVYVICLRFDFSVTLRWIFQKLCIILCNTYGFGMVCVHN